MDEFSRKTTMSILRIIYCGFIFGGIIWCNSIVHSMDTIFEKDILFGDSISDTVQHQIFYMVPIKSQCATRCSLYNSCQSFFYHHGDQICQLNHGTVSDLDLTPYNGSLFYKNPGISSASHTLQASQVVLGSTKINNPQAKNMCVEMGGRLVVTDTWDKLNTVIDVVVDTGVMGQDYYLGGEKGTVGWFHWLNGVPINTTMFRQYEPSNDTDENCITISPNYLGTLLNDDTCTSPKYYICETL